MYSSADGSSSEDGLPRSTLSLKWLSPLAVLNEKSSRAICGFAASSCWTLALTSAFSVSVIGKVGNTWPCAAAASNSGRRLWYQAIRVCMDGMSMFFRFQTIALEPTGWPSKLMSPTL
ncbi:hypothetical protein D3C80_1249290 [compost metagenome]